MGISSDNWPATVGLITGILAKEVVIGTLNTLYTKPMQTQHAHIALIQPLKNAVQSIPNNLHYLIGNLHHPITTHAPKHLSPVIYGKMIQQFNGPIGALAYLLFILLYFPCLAAISTIAKELNWRWASFSIIWNTSIAYAVATTFYQIASFTKHPVFSKIWIVSVLLIFSVIIILFKYIGKKLCCSNFT